MEHNGKIPILFLLLPLEQSRYPVVWKGWN